MSGDIEKLDIKWLDIIKKYNIFNEVAYVSTGDIGLVIAARKFYELSNLISCANYSIEQAEKSEELNRKSYFLRYAILAYNACYDYLEQIVYFAFDFFPFIKSEADYIQAVSRCIRKDKRLENGREILEKSDYANDIEKLKVTNQEASSFFSKYNKMRKYRFDGINGIGDWANNIKHQGGFCFKELLTPSGHTVAVASSEVVFTTKILTPYTPTIKEAIERLINQNRKIIELSNWMFEYIFGDTTVIDFSPKQKPFSANKHQFNNIKLDNVYATEQ